MIFSFVTFPLNAHATPGHDPAERLHTHCANGVVTFATDPSVTEQPDCGDDSPAPTPAPAPAPTPAPANNPCEGIAGTVFVGGVCLPTEQALGIQDDPVQNILLSITMFVTGLIGVVAVLMIVISGVMYMLSAGDSARVETAKKILTYSIIGLIIALLAWVIVSVVSRVTGAGGLEASNPDGPVTGTEVIVCIDPNDSTTCITVQNNL